MVFDVENLQCGPICRVISCSSLRVQVGRPPLFHAPNGLQSLTRRGTVLQILTSDRRILHTFSHVQTRTNKSNKGKIRQDLVCAVHVWQCEFKSKSMGGLCKSCGLRARIHRAAKRLDTREVSRPDQYIYIYIYMYTCLYVFNPHALCPMPFSASKVSDWTRHGWHLPALHPSSAQQGAAKSANDMMELPASSPCELTTPCRNTKSKSY